MPRIPINDVGRHGIIKDIEPHELPASAWSAGNNVRFRDNRVVKFSGHVEVFGTPSVSPYWAMSVPTATTKAWLYSSLTKMYTWTGTVHTDVTNIGGDYSTTTSDLWVGGLLGGIPVITNGVDTPQAWPDTANPLIDLANWPTGDTCQIIRPFFNYLLRMNVTKSGTHFPHLVGWSHRAEPGTLPDSWDVADATKDAGEFELSDTTAGFIRDGLPLGNLFVIYKDQATWGLQFIGGGFIFRRFPIFQAVGILSKHCVDVMPLGRRHAVATQDDIIVHDGSNVESLLTGRWKKFLSNAIDTDNFDKSFLRVNQSASEVWFCFPESGATFPTLAFVWNYQHQTIGVRELNNIPFIGAGSIQDVSDQTWDAQTTTWDQTPGVWDEALFAPAKRSLLICDKDNTRLYQADSSPDFDGVPMNVYVERTGLSVVDSEGNTDPLSRKLVTRIWPRAQGSPFSVRVGAQDEIGGAINWGSAKVFRPGVDAYLDFLSAGRLIAVRFQSDNSVSWEVSGYDLELEVVSRH